MSDRICSVDECDRPLTPPMGRGMCGLHYQRWRLHGDVHHARKVGRPPCTVEGCDEPNVARGWCTRHWTRWKRFGSPDDTRSCLVCTQQFEVSDTFRLYCSTECKAVAAKLVGRSWARQRRRRIADAMGEPFSVLDIFVRDEWVCRICSEPIDGTLRHPDPLSPSLDHVIPLSKGGKHDATNVQASHLTCNIRKGVKTTT